MHSLSTGAACISDRLKSMRVSRDMMHTAINIHGRGRPRCIPCCHIICQHGLSGDCGQATTLDFVDDLLESLVNFEADL
jgi:hypothetical protein